jgi:hypothetical protein
MLSDRARFPLAIRLRAEGAPIGEVFTFLSGLYFRGKIAYAGAFARPPRNLPGALVITPTRGLVPSDSTVTIDRLHEFASVDIKRGDERYRVPLIRDAARLEESLPARCDLVLLGSVASDKYVELLLAAFGARLRFPAAFVGRGDMSRGGLMLRSARAGVELDYVPVAGAARHGPRPPRLGPPRAVTPGSPSPAGSRPSMLEGCRSTRPSASTPPISTSSRTSRT